MLNAAADHRQLSEVADTGAYMRDIDLVFRRIKQQFCAAVGHNVSNPPLSDAPSASATISLSRSPGRIPTNVDINEFHRSNGHSHKYFLCGTAK